MAYAEKRGKGEFPWRARYARPGRSDGSEPGFRTKRAAEDWGEEQEAQQRQGVWIDPELLRTPFGTFAREKFMKQRVKRGRTMDKRWDLLDTYVLPQWEYTPLIGITWFDVDSWQMRLPCDDTTRGHCVTLISMILTAAVDARHLHVNPVVGRRRTKPAATIEDATAAADGELVHTPEQVLLVADRMGPARGLRILTTAWTGINFGEATGLHRDYAGLVRRQPYDGGVFECRILRLVQEVAEYEERDEDGKKLGTVQRLEPLKTQWRRRDLDLAPFLARLWDYHLADWPHEWVLSTPRGKWYRRGNWGAKYMRPAADGQPERPRRRGVSYREAWEPIAPGMNARSLRHFHDSMQAQIGVAAPLEHEQAGHKQPGIKGVYQHPTAQMRSERLEGLQAIYERAMRNLGWKTLWGRVDLVKPPPEVDLPNLSQLISERRSGADPEGLRRSS